MINRRSRSSRIGFIEFMVFGFMLLPLLAICSLFVPPSSLVLFQWLGITMPFILAWNTVVVFIYLLTKRRNYSILFIYIIGIGYYIPAMFQWSPMRHKEVVADLKIASYNVRDMRSDYGFSTVDAIVDLVDEHDVDILFMQEVPTDYSAEDLLGFFGDMQYVVMSSDDKRPGDRLAILSKYPLTAKETLLLDPRYPYALFATVDMDGLPLMLVNNHLQSTNWNQIDKHQPMSLFLEGSVRTISDNYVKRGFQTQQVRRLIDATDMPVIVAGDFNDPPVSYAYHTIGSGLTDSFRAAGNGYGYTYRFLQKLFRIDYIFYDSDYFEAYNFRTVKVDYSDHLPVFVDLVVRHKND